MYSTNESDQVQFNDFLEDIIEKSLFTRRQISIIYNKKNRKNGSKNMSSGAYYRQIKQCRNKIQSLLYSLLLLRFLNIVDNNTMIIIESIYKQINTILQDQEYHNSNIDIPDDVINIIEQIIKKTNYI